MTDRENSRENSRINPTISIEQSLAKLMETQRDLRYDLQLLSTHVFTEQKRVQERQELYDEDVNDLEEQIKELLDRVPQEIENTKTESGFETVIKKLLTDDNKEYKEEIISEVIRIVSANKPVKNNKLIYILLFTSLAISLFLLIRSII